MKSLSVGSDPCPHLCQGLLVMSWEEEFCETHVERWDSVESFISVEFNPWASKVPFPFIPPSPIVSPIGLGLKPLPRVSAPCWGTVQSSSRLAHFVSPLSVCQFIECGVHTATWLWRKHGESGKNQSARSQESQEPRDKSTKSQQGKLLCLGDYRLLNFHACAVVLSP